MHTLAEANRKVQLSVAGIEKDPGWGVPAKICVTNATKCGEGMQSKRRLWVKEVHSKRSPLAVK